MMSLLTLLLGLLSTLVQHADPVPAPPGEGINDPSRETAWILMVEIDEKGQPK